jgi:hypothetical protein
MKPGVIMQLLHESAAAFYLRIDESVFIKSTNFFFRFVYASLRMGIISD